MLASELAVGGLALAGVLAGAAGTFVAARRLNSGNIGTSNADSLWKAETSLREALATRVTVLEGRIDDANKRLDMSEAELASTRQELADTKELLAAVQAKLDKTVTP